MVMKIVLQREGSREHKVCLCGVSHVLSVTWGGHMLASIICAFFLKFLKHLEEGTPHFHFAMGL